MKIIKKLFIVFLAVFCLNAIAQNRIVRRGPKNNRVSKYAQITNNSSKSSKKNTQKEKVNKDEPFTTETLCLTALNGVQYSQMLLNYLFLKLGQPLDDETYRQIWLFYSSRQDNSYALSVLSWCYALGKGVEQNLEKALDYAQKSANNSNPWGWASLGFCYQQTMSSQLDEKRVFDYYKKAADAGVVMAQYAIGGLYHTGRGVARNEKESIRYYELAAQQGHPTAKSLLGLHYAACFNDEKAFKLYKESAEMYDVWGMCFLGKAYLEGKGTPVDFTQAFAWLQKAIDNGDPEAMCVMGNCYCNGNGVIKNLEKAFLLYKVAAENGWKDAYYNLGAMYYYGYGTNKNNDEALKWLLLAINDNLGNGELEYTVSKIYQEKGDLQNANIFVAAAISKNYQQAYLLQAKLLVLQGSKKRAKEILKTAIAMGVSGAEELLKTIK